MLKELEGRQRGWSIGTEGQVDAGGALGARQGQAIMRAFNLKDFFVVVLSRRRT